MSEQTVINAAEMINKVFSNIDAAKIENGNALSDAWKETVGKIYKYGQKLVCHSQIVDLKNGVLLVETDHPGWNQILQSNKNFILKGLRLKAKDVEIKTIAFRVKGNDAHLADDYKKYNEKAEHQFLERIEEDQKKLEQMGLKNETGKNEIPEEVKELFKGFFKTTG